jgi:hypothetical protein
MILLPFLSIKSMAVSAFHILGIRSAVASLSPLNQGAIRLPEQIAGSQDSFLGKQILTHLLTPQFIEWPRAGVAVLWSKSLKGSHRTSLFVCIFLQICLTFAAYR